MKAAIIVKYKGINRIILIPKVSTDQIFRISSSLIGLQKESSQIVCEDDLKNALKVIGITEFEIVQIVAEIN